MEAKGVRTWMQVDKMSFVRRASVLTLGGRCEAQLFRRRAAAPLHHLGCLLDTSKLRYFGYVQPGGVHRAYSGHPVEMMSLSWGEGGLGTSRNAAPVSHTQISRTKWMKLIFSHLERKPHRKSSGRQLKHFVSDWRPVAFHSCFIYPEGHSWLQSSGCQL